MPSYSKIKHLYAFEDGDTITPSMGVQIDTGFGLAQYVNPTTGKVIATKFDEHNATLFPQAYSSRKGAVVVPESIGQQWYLNAISDAGAILDDSGNVKSKFASMFKTGTVSINGNTFPALVIIGDLVNDTYPTVSDRYIYYVSSYSGKQFTCQQLIPVQNALAEACQLLISITGESGSGDEVLSNDNDWILYSAFLQRNGETIASGSTYKYQKLVGSEWQDCTTVEKETEVGTNSLKLYDAAVDGAEQYRCVCTYNGNTYYALLNPTDEHDPFYVDDGCNILGDAVKEEEKVTFSPKVYDRHTGEISTGWTFAYTLFQSRDWTDENGNTIAAGTVITDVTVDTLTGASIKEKGGINVRTTANRD